MPRPGLRFNREDGRREALGTGGREGVCVERKVEKRHPLWKVGECWTCPTPAEEQGKPGPGARCSCTKRFQRTLCCSSRWFPAGLCIPFPKWSRARVCCHGNRLSRGATQHHSIIHICVPPPHSPTLPTPPLPLSSRPSLFICKWKAMCK